MFYNNQRVPKVTLVSYKILNVDIKDSRYNTNILFDLLFRVQSNIADIINITIHPDKYNNTKSVTNLEKCHTYNKSKLWFPEQSTGYFYKGKWVLRHCTGKSVQL